MIVSIITVVKNDSKNIEKTINSVWRQNYKNLEHIIIDGKSNDGTYNIIKKNKEKISIFKSSKDKNLYDALNKGIKLSVGNIIGILHSGDLYANKNVIRKSVSFMRENNLDFVISNLNMIDKNNKVLRHVNTSNYFKKILLNFGIQPPHPTLFINKNIIKKVSYYSTKYKIVGDFDFFCKIFKIKSISWKNLDFVSVLQKRGGLSDGNVYSKLKMANDMSKILKENNYFSFKLFFILKFFLRIKEFIFLK